MQGGPSTSSSSTRYLRRILFPPAQTKVSTVSEQKKNDYSLQRSVYESLFLTLLVGARAITIIISDFQAFYGRNSKAFIFFGRC